MRKHRIPSRLFTLLVYIFLYAPIVLLIVFSFNATKSNRVWGGFSLDWYVELFHNTRLLGALRTTIILSVLAAFIATILGTAAAIGFYSMRRRSRSICLSVNNIPLTNADIITGVSMMLLFVLALGAINGLFGGLGLRLRLGFGTLLIAHITFNIPYVILSVGPKLRQMDRNLMEAAQDLGCTWMQAFWKVMLPEIKPGVVNGLLIAFTMSVDDFVISYFTAGPSTSTLAMTIYGMTKKRVTPSINAVSTLLFVTVVVLLVIINIREERHARTLEKRMAK